MRFFSLSFLITLFCLVFSQNGKAEMSDKYVSGIVLVESTSSFDFEAFKKAIQTFAPENIRVKDDSYSFEIRQSEVTLTKIETPIERSEWEPAALISWIWKNAETHVAQHQAQIVITVSGKDHLPVDLYKTFTRVAAAILNSSDGIGVYMNNQYLLVPKDYYLQSSGSLDDNVLPISLWVYFGMWQENDRNSGYTWGLQAFGMNEMEVVNSTHGIAEVQAFLMETSCDVVLQNIVLKTGDFVGDERKFVVRVSKGALIEGTTVKLDY